VTLDLMELLDSELDTMQEQLSNGINIADRCAMEGLTEQQTSDLAMMMVVLAEMFPRLVRQRLLIMGNPHDAVTQSLGEVGIFLFFSGMKYERHRDD
jgi:hypothetical protein